MDSGNPHIVVLGAGFGGLTFCESFRGNARVTLVDRQNHHLFQPLLYQVASAGLSAVDIAQPVRSILADRKNVNVLMDDVVDFKLDQRQVVLKKNTLTYDYLVVALGGRTSYFGHPEWEKCAPGLKSLDDALRIRREILLAFEKAEDEHDAERIKQLLTIVVVGGGPTGVELAGAFAELARFVLKRDFRHIDPRKARVILIEAAPRVLAHMPEDLSGKARQQLEHLGVEVRTGARVAEISPGCVRLEKGEIRAENIIWAAGVGASPLGAKLGVPLDRAGRVQVGPDLALPQRPEVFVIGDMAEVTDADGKKVPGVSPAAMQMARYVSGLIEADLAGPKKSRAPFRYWDKGTLATIGRSAGVAQVGKLHLTGRLAWLMWLGVHLIFLIGFRNKISVLLQWAYSYFAYKRGARIITGLHDE
ncbi:MAG TPA: NAD(P)/FAD-dependent oxidoreductase [Verrucomicrobiae bacterium]|jgi:NADH dehydrogenase|nr:NAD(P)/FAD-dependent oxidoreductase [Verrucomicrobiae bacterium]